VDTLSRPLRDLRISVTDRCNFRCTYCMPKEVFGRAYEFLNRDEILSFEEITRLARIFVSQGVEKVRLTGGEPTLRRDLPKLVAMLRDIPGVKDLTLTTNGSRLAEMARDLKDAGLDRVTVSLDSLDDAVFRAMNDVDFPVSRVLDGIEKAARVGLTPVKANMVVKRGVNEHTLVDFARHFQSSGHIARFIEYMDVGNSNGWRLDDVVTAAEIVEMINREMPIEPLKPQYRGEVARPLNRNTGGAFERRPKSCSDKVSEGRFPDTGRSVKEDVFRHAPALFRRVKRNAHICLYLFLPDILVPISGPQRRVERLREKDIRRS